MTPSADHQTDSSGPPSPSHPRAPHYRRPRTVTSTEEIDNTIIRPGSVRINVKGAYIVDPDTSAAAAGSSSSSEAADGTSNGLNRKNSNGGGSPTRHETSDIRLPNHTAVVSHIAVDVCQLLARPLESP